MKKYSADRFFRNHEDIVVQKNETTDIETPHTHEFVEVVYISKGEGTHIVNGVSYPVKCGNVLFINYRQTHSFIAVGEMTYYNFLIRPEFICIEVFSEDNAIELLSLTTLGTLLDINSVFPLVGFLGRELLDIEQMVCVMMEEYEYRNTGYKVILRGYMFVFLTKLFRRMFPDSDTTPSEQRNNQTMPINKIIEYIDEHLHEKITLNQLAEKCFYNPSYFSRVFKETYGKNLSDYIHKRRIESSLKLLADTNMPVEKIAILSGYSDKKLYYNQFSKYMGTTPKAYRQNSK